MAGRESHLTEQLVGGYLDRTLGPRQLLDADEHLQSCPECMEKVRLMRPTNEIDIELQEPDGDDPIHLSFDHLGSYVDNGLDPVETSIVELHLEDCAECQNEIVNLRKIRDELMISDSVAAEKDDGKASVIDRNKDRVPIWKLLVPAFGFASLAVLVWAAWFWNGGTNDVISGAVPPIDELNTNSPGRTFVIPDTNIENSNSNNLASVTIEVRDGSTTIKLRSDGTIDGLSQASPQLRAKVKNALTNGSLDINAADLSGAAGTLMGNSDGVPFSLSYPVGRTLLSQIPNFKWKQLTGAESYRVKIYDQNFAEVKSSPELKGTEWKADGPLQRGKVYRWQVTAVKGGQEILSPVRPAPDARFKIADSASAAEIESVRREFPDSNLMLGIAYANAGLISEAEREFAALLKRNPNSEPVKKLLSRVRSSH